MAIIYLLWSLRKAGHVWHTPIAKTVLVLAVLWLGSQIGSDLYRGIPAEDFLRGWAKITVLIISYLVCFVLIGHDFRRMVAFASGIMLAPVFSYAVNGTLLPHYKFIFGPAVSFFAFVLMGMVNQTPRPWLAIFPVAAAVAAFVLDARSLAGVTFFSAIYYLLLATNSLTPNTRPVIKLCLIVFLLGVAYSTIEFYNYSGSTGRLSETAQSKYEMQRSDTGSFNLLSGRGEAYYSVPKILESPLIGSGSWAKDLDYVTQKAYERGLDPAQVIGASGGLIPSHSHFLGAWLESGIFGAIFWMYILVRLGRSIWAGAPILVGRWAGAASFLLVLFCWDIFFSPFGGGRRLNNGFYLWMVTYFALTLYQYRLFTLRQSTPRPDTDAPGTIAAPTPQME